MVLPALDIPRALVGDVDEIKGIPLLLLDDFGSQPLSEAAQRQFLSCHDERMNAGLQTVLTASASPSALGLDARLTARLNGSLVAELGPPGMQTHAAAA